MLRHTFKRQRSTILSRSPIAGPDLASGSTRQQNIIIPLNLVVFHKRVVKANIITFTNIATGTTDPRVEFYLPK